MHGGRDDAIDSRRYFLPLKRGAMTNKPVRVVLAAAVLALLLISGPTSPATPALGAGDPTELTGFEGLNMLDDLSTNIAPSDGTGAMGPERYVELVNRRFGIYDRSGQLLQSGTLADLTGLAGANLLDSEVMWDPHQGRFFYSMIDTDLSFSTGQLAFGFSRGERPDVDGWCNYTSDFGTYGTAFPDFPRLGDTQDFVLIGVNRFSNGRRRYRGSDLAWYSKPAPGPIASCPDPATLVSGTVRNLKNPDGSLLFSPVPAKQTDPSDVGYVLGTVNGNFAAVGTSLSLIPVRKEPATGRVKIGPLQSVGVPLPYSKPPTAPQAGTPYELETLEGRLTQAISAIDPSRGPGTEGTTAIWTQHSVAASTGGLGSEVRWYEIDPATATLFQTGIVQSPDLYVYNGAISPDRAINGASATFGSDMVLGFNTSSESADVAIQMVSKIGAEAQSGFVLVQQSPGPNIDSSCFDTPPCRWGDFAGASPDPAASPLGATGTVWLTGTYNQASVGNRRIDWRTWNWEAQP